MASILAVAVVLLIRNVEFVRVLFLTHVSRSVVVVDVVAGGTELGLTLLH